MRTLIAANWKMHGSMDWVDKPARFDAILSPSERKDIDVLICPPALYIAPMTAASDTIAIGAQNCHHADTGAHTGEISATHHLRRRVPRAARSRGGASHCQHAARCEPAIR